MFCDARPACKKHNRNKQSVNRIPRGNLGAGVDGILWVLLDHFKNHFPIGKKMNSKNVDILMLYKLLLNKYCPAPPFETFVKRQLFNRFLLSCVKATFNHNCTYVIVRSSAQACVQAAALMDSSILVATFCASNSLMRPYVTRSLANSSGFSSLAILRDSCLFILSSSFKSKFNVFPELSSRFFTVQFIWMIWMWRENRNYSRLTVLICK